MGSFTTVITRKISGTGLIRITDEYARARQVTINADILRPPTTKYENYSSNPPTSFYAKISLMRGERVIEVLEHKYESQKWDFVPDPCGQTLIATQCSYEGVLTSFTNLGVNLGLIPIEFTDTIKDFRNLGLQWDAIRVKCYADTALQISLTGIKYDTCKDTQPEVQPLGEPIEPPNKVSSGTPINIDPPYDDDDNVSEKNPLDNGYIPIPCTTIIRGAGLNANGCVPLPNLGDYTYNGYAELKPTTFSGCPGLQVFLDGVNLGSGQIYHVSAIILSRSGDCVAP